MDKDPMGRAKPRYSARHYEDFAKLFRSTMPAKTGPAEFQWHAMRTKTADLFEADNPKFKRDKFMEASLSPSGPYHSGK